MVAVMVPVNALAEYIQKQMRRMGLDASGLAQAAKLPESTARPIIRGSTRTPDIVTLHAFAKPLGVSFESLCRVAVGLPADAPELIPEPSATRRELLELFDSLEPEAQDRAVKVLRTLVD